MSLIFTLPVEESSSGSGSGSGLRPGRNRRIYLGGKSDAKSRSKLEQWGITHILNMTPEKDSSIQAGVPNYFEHKTKKITYRRIPVYDLPTTNLLSYAPSIVSFISNGLHYGNVFIHCQRGASRSASALIMYLMNKRGMTLNESLNICQKRRECVNPIPAFIDQLKQYEGECREKGLIVGSGATITKTDTQRGEDVDATSKKRKAVVGPAIGPTRGATKPRLRVTTSSKIGPSLPPHLLPSSKEKECNDDNDGDDETSISPNAKKSKIGPPMPPKKTKNQGPIGPQMPSNLSK